MILLLTSKLEQWIYGKPEMAMFDVYALKDCTCNLNETNKFCCVFAAMKQFLKS